MASHMVPRGGLPDGAWRIQYMDGVWCVWLTIDVYGVTIQGVVGDEWVVGSVSLWDWDFFVFWWGVVQR